MFLKHDDTLLNKHWNETKKTANILETKISY